MTAREPASDIVVYIPDDGYPTEEQRSHLAIVELLLESDEAMEAARAAVFKFAKHTVRGETSETGWPYGTTHDYSCQACLVGGASFTASPRSETYWAS